MRYKLGERVRVPALKEVGKIVDIDPDWMRPYEIEFDRGNKYDVELFTEAEIEPFFGIVEEKEPSFIKIKFQEGAIQEHGENGCQIEDVIDVLVERLQGFQNGGFPCRENALAITHLQEAQNWLYRRTMERKKQGVEGKSEKHV